ncbi:MAG: aldo/keto reductase, partial [Chloroflexota bacterium]
EKYVPTWLEMEKLYAGRDVKALGVSNFYEHHFEDVLAAGELVPTVNQVELHPRMRLANLHGYLKQKGCYIEAWSPLMRAMGDLFTNQTLLEIAETYGKSVAQVVLRWHLQHEIIVIPKSVNPSRIAENGSIFDFALSADEVAKIDSLDQHHRIGPDPDNFNF